MVPDGGRAEQLGVRANDGVAADGHVDVDVVEECGYVVTHFDLAPGVLRAEVLRVDLDHPRADIDNLGLRAIWPIDKVLEGHAEEI